MITRQDHQLNGEIHTKYILLKEKLRKYGWDLEFTQGSGKTIWFYYTTTPQTMEEQSSAHRQFIDISDVEFWVDGFCTAINIRK